MSGPDNLRGIDYQIACSVFIILTALANESSQIVTLQVESLDEDGEDLTFRLEDGRVNQIQIKKRAEGYNWTPASLRPVLAKFAQLDRAAECWFISDGSASRQLLPLKRFLEGTAELTDEVRDSVCNNVFSPERLLSLRGRLRIDTRYYPSPKEADPAATLRTEIRRLLLSGPFSLTADPIDVSTRLWRTVYSAGREAGVLSRTQLLDQLAYTGVRLVESEWARYPVAPHFYPHSESAGEIAKTLIEGGVQLMFGIGGSGKTTLAAEGASIAAAEGRRSCWLPISEFLEPVDFVRAFAEYCTACSIPLVAERLRECERVKLPATIADVLHRYPTAVVIDRFEAAGPRLFAFIRDTLMALPSSGLEGSIVVISRSIPDWWPEFLASHQTARVSPVRGMPTDSAVAMLTDFGVGIDESERRELVERVGAHAQSLIFLRQIQPARDTPTVHADSIEAARDWLVRRVLDQLPEREKIAIARASIFNYATPIESVHAVLGELGPDALRALQKRDLVRVSIGTVTLHDAIRDVALGLLSPVAVQDAHRTVADYLFTELKRQFELKGSVSDEKAMRWAVHLRASWPRTDLGGRFPLILASDPIRLRALFAILYLGFPFEFDVESLDSAVDVHERLKEEELIEENPANTGKKFLERPALRLRDFTFYEKLLLWHLCIHEGYAGPVGYMNEMRPNFAFGVQGLVCPWEHCIELSPLPPMTRGEWEAGLEEDRRRLAEAEAQELTKDQIAVLRERVAAGVPDDAPTDVDEELEARSCPLFGHACPGGAAQARTCRANESSRFRWATETEGCEHKGIALRMLHKLISRFSYIPRRLGQYSRDVDGHKQPNGAREE
jgi:hypothetical protein